MITSSTSPTRLRRWPAWSGWCSHGLRVSRRGSLCRVRCAASSVQEGELIGSRLPRLWLTQSRLIHGSRRLRQPPPSPSPLTISTTKPTGICSQLSVKENGSCQYVLMVFARLKQQSSQVCILLKNSCIKASILYSVVSRDGKSRDMSWYQDVLEAHF